MVQAPEPTRLRCRHQAMVPRTTCLLALLALASPPCSFGAPLAVPAAGRYYHGVYPGGRTGYEDDIRRGDVATYESTVGKRVAWVYFSHNWFHGRAFPLATCQMIRERGSVPFIRLMLRSDADQDHAEPLYSLRAILRGEFDGDLRAWFAGAAAWDTPLLVEWGTEMNGEWFSWNGRWNGAGKLDGFGSPTRPDGPERFVSVYRKLVTMSRSAGADNLTWVWHANAEDWPEASWNRLERYWPGAAYVDWIGVSAYGPQTPMDTEYETFRAMMDAAYPRLSALAGGRPLMVLEFGCADRNPLVTPAQWAAPALADILKGRWPRVRGFSWWNEWWQNDSNPAHDTTMRVQDIPGLANVFRSTLSAQAGKLVTRPLPGSACFARGLQQGGTLARSGPGAPLAPRTGGLPGPLQGLRTIGGRPLRPAGGSGATSTRAR